MIGTPTRLERLETRILQTRAFHNQAVIENDRTATAVARDAHDRMQLEGRRVIEGRTGSRYQ